MSQDWPSATCSRMTETGIRVPLITGLPLHTLGSNSILLSASIGYSEKVSGGLRAWSRFQCIAAPCAFQVSFAARRQPYEISGVESNRLAAKLEEEVRLRPAVFDICQTELLPGYSIRGGTPVEHAKKKAPRPRGSFSTRA